MKKNKTGARSSFGLPSGERAVWDADKPDYECDCPGPPPQFYLPPPPRPSSLGNSDCVKNSAFIEICESVPVIDAEYHYRPAISSFAIILTVVVVLVVFLIFGTFLVVLKKKKMRNLISRKYSPQDLCDSGSTNGVIYEDLTDIRSRVLSPHCLSGQTTLPPIEMIDVSSHSDRALFTPVFICPASPVLDSYNSQEVFNPVYEELSTGSEERDETDSEEMPRVRVSEDEFAEDELSLNRETDVRLEKGKKQEDRFLRGFIINNICRDPAPSAVDDRRTFLENPERNFKELGVPSDQKEKRKRTNGGSCYSEAKQKPKSLARKKIWKAPSTLKGSPADRPEFHEGFLLKKVLHIYPDVTDMGLQCSRRTPIAQRSQVHSFGKSDSYPHRTKPDIFSTFGDTKDSVKNQSQDSSLGSDSGYSNNTSVGKSSRVARECTLPNLEDLVLS